MKLPPAKWSEEDRIAGYIVAIIVLFALLVVFWNR